MKLYIHSIKIAAMCFLIVCGGLTTNAFEQADSQYANVLRSYVKQGSVDYGALKSNPGNLKSYLQNTASVSKEEFDKWPRERQLAFLINLYNAETLDLVQENYPIGSIKEIYADTGGPWEQPVVNLFGEMITLNSLENDIIRKNYNEPRIHFALVCAAKGCPVLIGEPYSAETLKTQLETQTKVFLQDTTKNSIDKENKVLKLSPLFDWFAGDFVKKSGSVINFVNPYLSGGAAPDFKIEYTEYDWSLNGISRGNE